MPGRIDKNPEPSWEKASHNLHPSIIGDQYDRSNGAVRRANQRAHYKRLCAAIRDIVVNDAHPYLLSTVAEAAIQDGLPVDPHALFASPDVLATEARYLCLAIPGLSTIHKDARGWLAWKQRRDPDKIEGSIPWNLAVGGVSINPSGE